MNITYRLIHLSTYTNIQDLNIRLKAVFKSYYNKTYTNKFSTAVIDSNYTINPIIFKISNINNKNYFSLYTLFNTNNGIHIYYKSLIECINNFNDKMLKKFYSFQKVNIFNKLLMKLKVFILLQLHKKKLISI